MPPGNLHAVAPPPASVVLLLEDDAELRDVIARFLGTHGFEVHEASDAAEAVHLLRVHKVDVVVADFELDGGGMQGDRFLLLVRETYPEIRRILWTGRGSPLLIAQSAAHVVLPKGPVRVLLDTVRLLAKR